MKSEVETQHTSVLIKEAISALNVQPCDTVVDATIGGAGHFSALLSSLGEGGVIVGIDADSAAVERGRDAYAQDRRPERPIAHIVNDNFRNLKRILERLNVFPVNAILFDLGWSGYQMSSPRGFSFSEEKRNQPLLMNYSDGTGETAAGIVNSYSEDEIADVLFTYGEERFARDIARSIVSARSKKRILTAGDLVDVVLAGTPSWYHKQKIHPATKTFQALRIAVNDEITALREGLVAAIHSLAPSGKLAVISFHSIEDRCVKNILREASSVGSGTMNPKKPIVPSRAEILSNRRSRSAKLRVFERADVISYANTASNLEPMLSYV